MAVLTKMGGGGEEGEETGQRSSFVWGREFNFGTFLSTDLFYF